jgi:hypothetical protein
MNFKGFNKKIMIVSLVYFLIIGLLFGLVIISGSFEINNMQADIEARRLDLEQKYIKGDDLNKVMKNLDKVGSDINRLNGAYIVKGKELLFITAMEEIAAKHSVDQKINLGSSVAFSGTDFFKTTVQINSRGTFQNIMNYLRSLESMDYYLNITDISLSKSAPSITRYDLGGSGIGEISISINSDAFIRNTGNAAEAKN